MGRRFLATSKQIASYLIQKHTNQSNNMADSFKIFGIVVRKQEVIDKSQDPPAREIAEIGVNKQSVRLIARHIQEVDGSKK